MSNATLASLLPLAVIAPIGGAILAPLAARLHRRLPLVISIVALAAALAVLLVIAPRVYGGRDISHYMGNVVPVGGHVLGIAFAADPFGMTFAIAAAAIGALLPALHALVACASSRRASSAATRASSSSCWPH